MITDKIENCSLYNLDIKFRKAFAFITGNSLKELPVGKHNIMGEEVFALVSEYSTKSAEESFLEGHKKYADIQCIISGNELIGYAPFGKQELISEYNGEKDFHLFKGEASFFILHEGMFALFYPGDLHMPGIKNIETAAVKKMVIKVAL